MVAQTNQMTMQNLVAKVISIKSKNTDQVQTLMDEQVYGNFTF